MPMHKLRFGIERGMPYGALRDSFLQALGQVRSFGHLQRRPRGAVDLARGAALFQQACAACHGTTGALEGARARSLQPAPPVLRSRSYLAGRSVARLYDVVTYGEADTAMPAFSTLSEADRWALAFFVFTLPRERCVGAAPVVSWSSLANDTDETLQRRHGNEGTDCLRLAPPGQSAAWARSQETRPKPTEVVSAAAESGSQMEAEVVGRLHDGADAALYTVFAAREPCTAENAKRLLPLGGIERLEAPYGRNKVFAFEAAMPYGQRAYLCAVAYDRAGRVIGTGRASAQPMRFAWTAHDTYAHARGLEVWIERASRHALAEAAPSPE
jgi:mono/diheme cytochrome c family protein